MRLKSHDDFEGWREAVKTAFAQNIAPGNLNFEVEGEAQDLFADIPEQPSQAHKTKSTLTVPKPFLDLARTVVCHSNPERFALLYRILIRLQGDKSLLMKSADRDIHRANRMAKEIRRDAHKMKAFVRFRKTGETGDVEQFVAWFEPSHHIVRYTAPFFMRRFTGMQWSILTPKGCVHWNGEKLTFSDPVPKSHAPEDDALEDYWKSYYASIFNPARLKIDAMTSEMPKKYWRNLPEATLIPDMVKAAQVRESKMVAADATTPNPAMMAHREVAVDNIAPDRDAITSIEDLNTALKACQACPLWQPATQAVCGRGNKKADLMLVGEQPGDREDLDGRPFIGPAGDVLQTAMEEAQINDPYLTNAVKHFKFEPRGKRRLHKNPSVNEIDHCSWWLHKEIKLVQPKVIVALGASSLRGITGKPQKTADFRGRAVMLENNITLITTYHPSYILRLQDEDKKRAAYATLVSDLEMAGQLLTREREISLPFPGGLIPAVVQR